MLPPIPQSGGGMQKLTKIVKTLSAEDQAAVMAFAEFLQQRAREKSTQIDASPVRPESIERPEEESVVTAIRRLTRTYPMIDKDEMLHDTADLMTAHVIKGKPADEVIDDLEQLFAGKYEEYLQRFAQE